MLATRETALRPSPCFYKTERRRTLGERRRDLELELEAITPDDYRHDVAEYELELTLAALEPLGFREAWEDVAYAWRRLGRTLLEAFRK